MGLGILMARPSPVEMAYPGWRRGPPRARRYYVAALVLVALCWVAILSLVLLPPGSALVAFPLLYLPFGAALAVLLAWRGVRIARRHMREQLGAER